MPPSIRIKFTSKLFFRYFLIPNNNASRSDSEFFIGTLKNLYFDLSGPEELKNTHDTVCMSPAPPLTSKPTIPILLVSKFKLFFINSIEDSYFRPLCKLKLSRFRAFLFAISAHLIFLPPEGLVKVMCGKNGELISSPAKTISFICGFARTKRLINSSVISLEFFSSLFLNEYFLIFEKEFFITSITTNETSSPSQAMPITFI